MRPLLIRRLRVVCPGLCLAGRARSIERPLVERPLHDVGQLPRRRGLRAVHVSSPDQRLERVHARGRLEISGRQTNVPLQSADRRRARVRARGRERSRRPRRGHRCRRVDPSSSGRGRDTRHQLLAQRRRPRSPADLHRRRLPDRRGREDGPDRPDLRPRRTGRSAHRPRGDRPVDRRPEPAPDQQSRPCLRKPDHREPAGIAPGIRRQSRRRAGVRRALGRAPLGLPFAARQTAIPARTRGRKTRAPAMAASTTGAS